MIFGFNKPELGFVYPDSRIAAVINDKLDHATQRTRTPRNEAELRSLKKNEPMQFKAAKSIDALATIPLSATTSELRKKVDEIEECLDLKIPHK